jgi:hypothetical protein
MEAVRVERVEHGGLMAAVIEDVGLMDSWRPAWDPILQRRARQAKPWAEGCSRASGSPLAPAPSRPCFLPTPLDVWVHDGVHAARFHRFTLGRVLEAVDPSGGDRLGRELALAAGCTL